jgi:hypothetical protein
VLRRNWKRHQQFLGRRKKLNPLRLRWLRYVAFSSYYIQALSQKTNSLSFNDIVAGGTTDAEGAGE